MKTSQFLLILLAIVFNTSLTIGQNISGKLIDAADESAIIGNIVSIENSEFLAYTNSKGVFRLIDVPAGSYVLLIDQPEGKDQRINIEHDGNDLDLGTISVEKNIALDPVKEENEISIISLSDNELELDEGAFEASSVLNATRDPFLNTAAFAWGAARFNPRGLTSEYTSTYINGIPMQEMDNGRLIYGQWGGLNDVFRNVTTDYGIKSSEYGLGGMTGNANINLRAGNQREQTRISYARSNRSYSNRVMITHSSGFNNKGWAYTLSGSRRWAQEGYVAGSFYDAAAYFAGVEKIINRKHNVHLTVFGAPNRRGKSAATLLEIADIVDDPYYNSYWGYQNGKKRNSRVGHSHQPTAILGHDWKVGDHTKLNTALSYQAGVNGSTALNWGEGSNPAADYHQKLPSRIEDDATRQQVIDAIAANPNFFQVDWDGMYNANLNNYQEIENSHGSSGEIVTGNASRYIVEDRRFDSKELRFATTLNHRLSSRNVLNAGIRYNSYNGHIFTEIEDLLGGDFYLDLDRFADPIGAPGTEQPNLETPNNVVREGDVFGYDYNVHVVNPSLWVQDNISLRNLDLFLGAEVSSSEMWRTGNMRNGYYPDNSLGDSEKQSFNNYILKGGATYKISRHRIWASAYKGTKAPFLRNSLMSPRNSNIWIPNLTESQQESAEIGYGYKSPSVDFRATGYYATVEDESEVFFFYSDQDFTINGSNRSGAFGSFVMNNLDKRHVGIELLAQVKMSSTVELKAAASVGQHLYTDRFSMWALADEIGFFRQDQTIYSKNFFVETSPQTAYNFELKYNSPHYWFATLNLNYMGNRYLDFSPERRTIQGVSLYEEGSQELLDATIQEKVASAMTVDLFAYKSFKLSNGHFIYLTLAVSNILNEDFFSGGYEQLRFDSERGPDYFDTKYYRAYGRNFFAGIAYKF